MGSIKKISHQCGKAKRRLYFKLQHWMWRKRWEEKCPFRKFTTKRQASRTRPSSGPHLILKTQLIKNKRRCPRRRTLNHASAAVPLLACATEDPENMRGGQKSLLKLCESDSVSEGCETADASVRSLTMIETNACGNITPVPRKVIPSQRLEAVSPSGKHAVPAGGEQAPNTDTEERTLSSSQSVVTSTDMIKDIHEFLSDFYRIYGSFIPLQRSDVLTHLKLKYNEDFSDRKNDIISEVTTYQNVIVQEPLPFFQVVYKKHTLTLEDLLTLADQNWLNDQVINLYGELIMASAHQEVHFLNSFFHRQLMTKGYDGVKRWTKQVDLFSKSLLLVPIHLEVHWCLVTADIVNKRICLYDSQGNALQKVARNILKYLITMAKEKRQTAFEDGWTVSYTEKSPQQTNENDCGVFVLEYCRCLALAKPLHFSQSNIPKIRKRIYKELCDRRLHEEG
ncbi:sentrin-specific protease 5-like [Betta splendens]|uniref:Sentrin-specific protease 5-like n=1 Tax=Betta splendens TaxID=158456 RepID=A0A6P7L6A0_BETSP|nr:sentrin-specific protease 5-like [Betta splendens]XP_028988699.1 sentrin-specific protease 5-like [Betta splendens]